MTNQSFLKAFSSFRYSFIVLVLTCFLFNTLDSFSQISSAQKKWTGTWSTAPQLVETSNMPPDPGLKNNSLRQEVRVSIGGDTIRVKFSNEFSTDTVVMNSVQIAVSTGSSTIDIPTNKELKFKGNAQVKMNPGTAVTSDPIAFKLNPRMDVAITIYFGKTSSTVTGHPGSRTTSYILSGNTTTVTDFTGCIQTDHWYVINGIDVLAPSKSAAVAIIGNSITDGRGSETNKQNRWPDILSERLLADTSTNHVGVLNMGIGGNCVLGTCLGPSALNRFERDVLNQAGLRWIVIFEGVNDIGYIPDNASAASTVANNLINAYKQMIEQAHTKNIRIYGATIMPFKNNSYYTQYRDVARNTVNDWIRNSGFFDGVIDFDKVMRDTTDTASLLASLQADYLHPNVDGHRTMGAAVNLKLFAGSDTIFPEKKKFAQYFEAECTQVGSKFSIVSDINASNGKYVSSVLNITTLDPTDIASHMILSFTVPKDTTYHIYGLLNCANYNDDSYWVKLDAGSFVMVNGLNTGGVWSWLNLSSYALTSGSHTLTIANREDGAKLDKLLITDYLNTPSGKGDTAINICIPTNVKTLPIDAIKGWALNQNYPNPFSGKTSISFENPKESYVSLKVYNIHGSEIKELAGKIYSQGTHTVEFNQNNLPEGVYFYRIMTDQFSAERKMVVNGE